MPDSPDLRDSDVEDRIDGKFLHKIRHSDVDFQISEMMEDLVHEDDFGGKDEIVLRIEQEVMNHED